jgi:hypothetical protein
VVNTTSVTEDAPANVSRLVVANGDRLPTSGKIVRIGGVAVDIDYIRTPGGNVLALGKPLAQAVPAGTAIEVTPNGSTSVTHLYIAEGGGCAISGGDAGGLGMILGGLVVGALLRRRAR